MKGTASVNEVLSQDLRLPHFTLSDVEGPQSG